MSYVAPIVPANSPFSPAQQAWLNGLLAGLLGPDQAMPIADAADAMSALPALQNAAPAPEDFPWHDPALPLDRGDSEKDTRHIVFRHSGLPLAYKVGDALGVHVANDPEVVAIILERLGAVPSREVDCPDGSRRPLSEALLEVCDIGRPS